MKDVSLSSLRKRRTSTILIALFIFTIVSVVSARSEPAVEQTATLPAVTESSQLAIDALYKLKVKGRAPKTDYSRGQFGDGWADYDGCDMRNIILQRSLTNISISNDGCVVLKGNLPDPYTGKEIMFLRGSTTSSDVQIDHVVALSDAWQKGAQQLSFQTRQQFANDPLNLLAVSGDSNQIKGDSDAASWLPENKSFRCLYVARQIAVKQAYNLWVTEAELAAMRRILNGCGDQALPVIS